MIFGKEFPAGERFVLDDGLFLASFCTALIAIHAYNIPHTISGYKLLHIRGLILTQINADHVGKRSFSSA